MKIRTIPRPRDCPPNNDDDDDNDNDADDDEDDDDDDDDDDDQSGSRHSLSLPLLQPCAVRDDVLLSDDVCATEEIPCR